MLGTLFVLLGIKTSGLNAHSFGTVSGVAVPNRGGLTLKTKKDKKHIKVPPVQSDEVDDMIFGVSSLPPERSGLSFAGESGYEMGRMKDEAILDTIFDEYIQKLELPFDPEQNQDFLGDINTEFRKQSKITIEYYKDGGISQLIMVGNLKVSESDPYTHTMIADVSEEKFELLKKLFIVKEES